VSLSTVDKVFLVVGLIDFGGIFIWIGVAMYLAYSKMELMLSHFKNSPTITVRIFLIRAGILGRLHIFGLMMGLMVMPGIFLRKGGVSAEDLKSFPADLKRTLVVMQWVNWGLLLVALGLFVVIQLEFV
jgi:hypothetical protein